MFQHLPEWQQIVIGMGTCVFSIILPIWAWLWWSDRQAKKGYMQARWEWNKRYYSLSDWARQDFLDALARQHNERKQQHNV